MRVFACGRMWYLNTPMLATPTEPQSSTVVAPDWTPPTSGVDAAHAHAGRLRAVGHVGVQVDQAGHDVAARRL